ncbi:MAG: hypothetical protein IJA88_01065 [Clostridia bacterium]|nr:hypothetical protein [Clostridia bacterium]
MKKILSTIIALTIALTTMFTFSGCQTGEKIDPNRTQIYVSVQSLGVGYQFAYNLKTEYEKYNKDAQVIIIENGTADAAAEISNGGYDVYMITNATIGQYVKLADNTSDYFVDLTDVITDGENSIHDRLFDSSRDYYNVGTSTQPKYFALPWFTSYYGTVYDVDLFEANHYFSNDEESVLVYEGYDGIAGNEDDNWGPDGKENTFDDGLPATYGDLKQLMLIMKGDEVTPFSWTSFPGYAESWLSYIWSAYEGQNYTIMTDFEGEYFYKEYDETQENYVTKSKIIDNTNGYEMAYQNGKYAAIKVAEDIIGGNYYLPASLFSSQGNIIAQTAYLNSVESSTTKPIAFLFEGTWWENEAKSIFNEMATNINKKYAYKTRKFGFMPFPRFVGEGLPDGVIPQWNEKVSIRGGDIGDSCSMVGVSKKSSCIDMAKDFVKFAYSEAMCANFNVASGCGRPLQYSMSPEQLNQITYYQKQVYEIAQLSKDPNSNVEVVSGQNRGIYISTDPNFVEDIASFHTYKTGTTTKVTSPLDHFATAGAMTAEEYFAGIKRLVTKNLWDGKFGSLFN